MAETTPVAAPSLFLVCQQAMPNDRIAAPAIRPATRPAGVSSVAPTSNEPVTTGIISAATPTTAASNADTMSRSLVMLIPLMESCPATKVQSTEKWGGNLYHFGSTTLVI